METEPFDPALARYCSEPNCDILVGYGKYGARRIVMCARCQTRKMREAWRKRGWTGGALA